MSIVSLLVFLCVTGLDAQKEASHWLFGHFCTLDFTKDPYDASGPSELRSLEGSASWSDFTTGQLLFYTDGQTIWDANHEHMPGSNPQYVAAPNYRPYSFSTSQAALVVPHSTDPNKWYVFNPGNFTSNAAPDSEPEISLNRYLSYFLVDLDLRDGMGDVAERKVIFRDEEVGERLTGTIACARGGHWVLCANAVETRMYAFLVDADGVRESPVVSKLISRRLNDKWSGVMKLSPNGEMLAFGCNPYESDQFEIYDFDTDSGLLSNPRAIPHLSVTHPYGLSFSPDSRRLYTISNFGEVDQYTVDPADRQSIIDSRVRLRKSDRSVSPGAAQIGPDGRIYIANLARHSMLVINDPNARGAAADLREHDINVSFVDKGNDRSAMQYGLPNYMDYIFAPDRPNCLLYEVDFEIQDICEGDCAIFRVNSNRLASEWEWEFEGGVPRSWFGPEPPPICYASAGSYPVRLRTRQNQQEAFRERRITVRPRPAVEPGEDLLLCRGESGMLQGRGDGEVQWSPAAGLSDPGILNPIVRTTEDREYTLSITSEHGCVSSASVMVRIDDLRVEIADVAAICPGQSAQLRASAGEHFEWSPTTGLSDPASLDPIATPRSTTVYTLRSWSEAGCSSSASVEVRVVEGGDVSISLPDTSGAPGQELRLPLVAEAPAELLPLELGRIRIALRYDARVLAFRNIDAGRVVRRSLNGSDELLLLDLPNPTIDQPLDTIAFLTLIGLIGLEHASDIEIEAIELEGFAQEACLDLRWERGRVLLDNYCLGYAVNFAARLQMRIHPNPASNNPQLELRNLKAAPAMLSVVDMFGREVWRRELAPKMGKHRELTIPALSLTPGLYYVQLLHGGAMHRRQLLVTR